MTINHRDYVALHFSENPQNIDLAKVHAKNMLFELPYLTLLDVSGNATQSFLQGQLTCDVQEVSANQMRFAALCNLQGRVIALMDVIQRSNLQLVLPKNLSEKVTRVLSKPAAFSRVQIQSLPNMSVFGFYLASKDDVTPFQCQLPETPHAMINNEYGCCYSLGNQAYLIIVESQKKAALIEPFIQKQQLNDAASWHALRLNQGHIEIYPNSSGLFLPHRLDLHLKGYLNFKKGCYRGQEIIARTHYRATLKHTLKQLTMTTAAPPLCGMKIKTLEGSEMGELIDFYPIHKHEYRIAASMLFEHPNTGRLEGQPSEIILKN
jgi:folate-binding protein YgfZ